MTKTDIDKGLTEISRLLTSATAVTICGSAALVIHGDISGEANDCDIIHIEPSDNEQAFLEAATTAATILGLDARWLNAEAVGLSDEAPRGWQERARSYVTLGNLSVQTMSRTDCVAMWLLRIKGDFRDRDIEAIKSMAFSDAETALLQSYLRQQEDLGEDMTAVRVAFNLL